MATIILKLGDKVKVENKFKPTFVGTLSEIHWHAFGGSGLVTNGKEERVFDTIVDNLELLG